MESNIIDLDEHRKNWTNGSMRCPECGKEWVAVYHCDCVILECPSCHIFTNIGKMVIENEFK
jgi:hypothetical protein